MSQDVRSVYGRYNTPPETPREEMWDAIVARIRAEGAPVADDQVSLDISRDISRQESRARRRWPAARGWAAAAAVLAVGIALGRATAPAPTATTETADATGPVEDAPVGDTGVRPTPTALDFAAFQHLGRSESLLTMVRADAREGRIDPAVAPWARNLLMETRLLLDARRGGDPTLDGLLAELELVLSQIVGVTETGGDEGRMRTELDLTVGGMDQREVLTRIRAVIPPGMSSE
jgi:hypothetical protein